ncbi:hypothetical protein GZH82_04840 [Staphylococcus ursi]|nr:hypothetical protein [Staphylococcus sp. MI 10-1553]QHW36734.1 hypothetical protein GZH82_04840 [Staphylococcus sp. MI 10-1553]
MFVFETTKSVCSKIEAFQKMMKNAKLEAEMCLQRLMNMEVKCTIRSME